MGLTTHDIVVVKDIKMFKKKSIISNTLEFDRREKSAWIIRVAEISSIVAVHTYNVSKRVLIAFFFN